MFLCKNKKGSVNVGDPAPDFLLQDQNGKWVSLKDFRGKKSVVLYFYPKDNTYACVAESSEFRDQNQTFDEFNSVIIGISSDSPASHTDFSAKYNLPFTLLSDPKNKARKLFNVPSTLGVIPGRVTFVIDKEGVIRHIFNSQFHPKSHVVESLNALKKITKATS
jgi:peroxiredoxin Q/BCP